MSQQLALDHIVYAVPDLASAIDEFRSSLGVAPSFGGRHEGLGTHNAILPLAGETYIELMATDPDAQVPNSARPFGLATLTSPRLVTWAVRSRDIESDVSESRARGYEPGMVLEMTRKQPGGETLRWKLSLRAEAFDLGIVPFVIDWGDAPHPAHGTSPGSSRCTLSSFSARHPEPDLVCKALDALGAELAVDPGTQAGLAARVSGPAGSIDLG